MFESSTTPSKVERLESKWWAANQREDSGLKLKIYKDMDRHYPYLDCPQFPKH